MIRREDALALLRQCKPTLERDYGVTVLGLFGSIARDQAGEASDVDVVIKMREPNLFALVHVKDNLEAAFHCHVDVVHYRDRMNAFLKQRIDQEAQYV
jgi:predicted nucleotidyltransferase